jgi:signal recognition particle subunit SRP54
VQQQCAGQEVIQSVSPGQQMVKVIHDELVRLLGEGTAEFSSARPLRVLLVGLQGSGKTTTAAKLGRLLHKRGYTPLLVACDAQRPAAIDQLETLAKAENLAFYADRTTKDVPAIARGALAHAATMQPPPDALIFDTAGRLQIAEDLIEEIKRVREVVQPQEVLLVADAALGQEAVNVAGAFHAAVQLTGIVLTKLDGDARGGAALSMKSVTGVPVKFAGTGEKSADFDVFHPDRMAQRILGMGDVMSLIEKAEQQFDQDDALELERKLRRNEFGLDDFLDQLRLLRKMGPLQGLLGMIPGFAGQQLQSLKLEERELDRLQAMILSMTLEERRRPELIKGSRRLRIARGSGTDVQQVNRLVKQFGQMRKVMRQAGRGKMPDIGAIIRNAR